MRGEPSGFRLLLYRPPFYLMGHLEAEAINREFVILSEVRAWYANNVLN